MPVSFFLSFLLLKHKGESAISEKLTCIFVYFVIVAGGKSGVAWGVFVREWKREREAGQHEALPVQEAQNALFKPKCGKGTEATTGHRLRTFCEAVNRQKLEFFSSPFLHPRSLSSSSKIEGTSRDSAFHFWVDNFR